MWQRLHSITNWTTGSIWFGTRVSDQRKGNAANAREWRRRGVRPPFRTHIKQVLQSQRGVKQPRPAAEYLLVKRGSRQKRPRDSRWQSHAPPNLPWAVAAVNAQYQKRRHGPGQQLSKAVSWRTVSDNLSEVWFKAGDARKEATMAKVLPYHTNSPEEPPKHREVYHDHDDCPDGRRIKPEHWVSGDRGKPRCDACKKLG